MNYSMISLYIVAFFLFSSCTEEKWTTHDLQEVEVLSLTNIEEMPSIKSIDFYKSQPIIVVNKTNSLVVASEEDMITKEENDSSNEYVLDFSFTKQEVDDTNNQYMVTRTYHCTADKQTMKGILVCETTYDDLTEPSRIESSVDITLKKKWYSPEEVKKQKENEPTYSSNDLSTFAATAMPMSPVTKSINGTIHLGYRLDKVPEVLTVQFGENNQVEDQRDYLYSEANKGYFIENGTTVPADKAPLWARSLKLNDENGDVLGCAWPTTVSAAADGRAKITLDHLNARVSISVRSDSYYQYPVKTPTLDTVLVPNDITDYVWDNSQKNWTFSGSNRENRTMTAVDAKFGNQAYGQAASSYESFIPQQTIASGQTLFSCIINDEVLTYTPDADLILLPGTHYNFYFTYTKDTTGKNVLRLDASDSKPWAPAILRSTPMTNPDEWEKDEEASLEFDSPISETNPVWEKVTSGWSSWAFDAKNTFVEDGHLVLRMTYAGDDNKVSYVQQGTPKEYNYVSGMLNTRVNKRYTYGYFEARIKGTSKFPGTCPAFWLWSDDTVRKANKGKEGLSCYNEIDIVEMEQVQTDVKTLECNLHAMMTENGIEYYKRPRTDNGKWAEMCQNHFNVNWDPRDDYHTYAVENRPDSIFWYIDDKLVAKKRNYYWHLPMQVTLSLGLRPPYEYYDDEGNRHPDFDKGTAEGFPSDMLIDYIRIWTKKDK